MCPPFLRSIKSLNGYRIVVFVKNFVRQKYLNLEQQPTAQFNFLISWLFHKIRHFSESRAKMWKNAWNFLFSLLAHKLWENFSSRKIWSIVLDEYLIMKNHSRSSWLVNFIITFDFISSQCLCVESHE